MSKVFISYSRKDVKEVAPIVLELRGRGVDCWYDDSIDSGDPQFKDTIMSRIRECEVFLYMLSENAVSSEYVQKEHRYAERKKKRIVPVLLSGAGDSDEVMLDFELTDCIDIYKEEQKLKLVRNLREWGCIDERIAGLLGELEKQRNRKDALLSEINTSKPKLKGLIAGYNAAAKEVFRLSNEISKIRTGHPESGDCESELISDVQETEKLSGRISELEKQIESLEAVKEKLEAENAEGSDHVRILESKLSETENLRMESERVSAGLRETIDECNQQIKDGKEQIARKDGIIAQLGEKCSKSEAENRKLSDIIHEKDVKLQAGSEQIARKDKLIESLREELNSTPVRYVDELTLPAHSSKPSSRSWLKWVPIGFMAAVMAYVGVTIFGTTDTSLSAGGVTMFSPTDTLLSATASLSVRHYVDLGLPSGTMWATCNVGASNPSDYGDYFAWGETGTKNSYKWANQKYRTDGDSYENMRFSKYVSESKYGTVDNKSVLEQSDDAAYVQWGRMWRMPTHEEWVELRENCDWKWTKQDGCNGYRVTSKQNGESIFLPAAGCRGRESRVNEGVVGHYWSSSLFSDKSCYAFCCDFNSDGVGPSSWYYRYFGLSVRPVSSSLQ